MENLNLSSEQKQALGIVDERVDYYFKVENTAIDGIEVSNPDTGEIEKIEAFNSIYEAHLYTVLSRYCNNNKVAFPSVSTLCRKCFCSKNTLLKAIKGLEEKGYIAKVKRFNKETKINETNIYAVKNICIPSSGDELGVVHHMNQGSSPREPKEEQVKKNNIKNKHVTCSDFKKSENKIVLGINPKGYPQKDEWEKFLNLNLIGIDYTPAVENAIKKLLKTEDSKSVEKILLETFKTGLATNRTIAEIATIIGTGNALRKTAIKPKFKKLAEIEVKATPELKNKSIEKAAIVSKNIEQYKKDLLDEEQTRLQSFKNKTFVKVFRFENSTALIEEINNCKTIEAVNNFIAKNKL
ncbi:MAG: helix-turn-helix domain-containing protein [Fusobacteriaceae bacterium]